MRIGNKDVHVSDDKMQKIMDCIEERDMHDLNMEVLEILMDGHLCEKTAMHKVKEMEPVALFRDGRIWASPEEHPVCAYMEEMGITHSKAHEHVLKAYERAKDRARELGISAPTLPDGLTSWDCWWCLAMVFSDYWITAAGDIDKASAMAYEYLSDPDR
nr:MAG TPA: hypothetical protein [Caudoviricetes sp.]